MKELNFVLQLIIVVILLTVPLGIAQEPCLTSTTTIMDYSSPEQASCSATNKPGPEKQSTRNGSVANVSLSRSVSAISLEQSIPDDPYIDRQWALSQIQVPILWQITIGHRDIIVAILDTGIDENHDDLNGKVVAEVNFTDSTTPQDIHGHGTHIAGIVGASSNNGIGIAGLAPKSQLMNVKVAGDKGTCHASVVAKGIRWAVDNGASVINISLELKEPSLELEDAINYAWRRGVLIIAAAGNDGSELPTYPAYYENCIAVAATGQDDRLAPLSKHGDWVDVAAPGFNIYSTLPDDSYGYKTGTSFAAAHVSGVTALLFSIVTDTNSNGRINDEVRGAIEAGCQEIGISGVGKGRIDAAKSLDKIE